MHQIQIKENGHWYTLGGLYDAVTADERVTQFTTCFTTKKGVRREFRVVQASARAKSASAERFENAFKTSRSPR